MLNHKSHLTIQGVEVKPTQINIKISDNHYCSVMIILQSASELKQIGVTNKSRISIKEISKIDPPDLSASYQDELLRLHDKYDRFKSSSTYLTHLAHLNSLCGNFTDASEYLNAALEVRNEPFLKHELGSALIEQGKDLDARSVFDSCELEQDVLANLRLAHLLVRQERVDEASVYVQQALDIDNTDYSARMFEGAINLWNHDWEKAVRSFRVALEENDKSAALYVNLAAAYWGLGEEDKAVKALRRAIFIDPLNENAVIFYSDVMFLRNAPEYCVQPLENILIYEQKNGGLWARIARAYYELATRKDNNPELLGKALDALKQKSVISDTPGVWNNIAVVYHSLRQPYLARRYFAQAWVKAKAIGEDEELTFSNLLSTLVEQKEYRNAFKMSGEFLKGRKQGSTLTKFVARIFLYHVISMEAIGKRSEAAVEAERLITEGVDDIEARVELFAHLFYYRTVIDPNRDIIEQYLPDALGDIRSLNNQSDRLICRALNNIVFCLLEFGEINRARSLLGELSRWVHEDPFATATLGLFHIKSGNSERAKELYQEAISMVQDNTLKGRIRQKMCLELGKVYLEAGDIRMSRRYLEKSFRQKNGFDYIKNEASKLLRTRLNGSLN